MRNKLNPYTVTTYTTNPPDQLTPKAVTTIHIGEHTLTIEQAKQLHTNLGELLNQIS